MFILKSNCLGDNPYSKHDYLSNHTEDLRTHPCTISIPQSTAYEGGGVILVSSYNKMYYFSQTEFFS